MTLPQQTKLVRATKTFVNNSGLLILGTIVALVWINIERDSYLAFAHSIHFVINDIARWRKVVKDAGIKLD